MYGYIQEHCPNLQNRIDEDEKKGVFNSLWVIGSDELIKYMSGLAGREIQGFEFVSKTCDEIEEKLKNANDKD